MLFVGCGLLQFVLWFGGSFLCCLPLMIYGCLGLVGYDLVMVSVMLRLGCCMLSVWFKFLVFTFALL